MNQQQGTIFSKVAMPIAITAIVVYLICSAWVGMRDPYKFTVAYTDYPWRPASTPPAGWSARRSPCPVRPAWSSCCGARAKKSAKGKDLAVVYQDETYVASQEELLQVQTNLTALQYAAYAGVSLWHGFGGADALVDDEPRSPGRLQREASAALEDQSATYRKLVLRREYLLSSDATAAMTQAAAQLQSRYDELQAHQSKASSIQAPVSGLFSSYVDGYETVLTPAKLEGLGPRDLEAFAQTDPTPADNVIGKLVTNAAWYYAITVPGDTVGRFDNGDSVDVFFDSLSESFPMTVYSVGEVQDNKLVVVLRSSQDDDKAEDLRQESGRVIFHSSEGIRVPKQALRITEDGERGVYVVVSQKARFRPVTILAEDDTSYLVKAAPTSEEDTRILRDGDQVVLASAELTDGKVVR